MNISTMHIVHPQRMPTRILWILFWAALQIGCSGTTTDQAAAQDFPTESEGIIHHSQGFQIKDLGEYHVLTVKNPFNRNRKATIYALVPRGNKPPEGFSKDRIIPIPIRSIAVTSNLHVGAIARLEAADFLVAVGDADQVYAPTIREKIAKGEITEIQKGPRLNEEKIIALQPDLLMVTGSPDEGLEKYAEITSSGVPVLVNSEWLETTPLGRAEWIKLMAVLVDRLNFSQHQFAKVEQMYQQLAQRAAQSKSRRPRVLLGNEFQGTWHMPGGKSFMSNLLSDAGADYPWKDNEQTGGIPLNFESVYPVGLEADVWLNIYAANKSLLLSDNRYDDFKSIKTGQLYSFSNRTNATGANDYWESSAFRPDLLLADYLHILHPDLLTDHQLYYCKKLD
jgi:iron complex transport system substrate-binding protein